MEHVLLLTHRIPYPPNKGDKIRSYQLLRYLAQHYHVHLGTFIDDPADERYIPKVEALCKRARFVRLDKRLARLRSLGGLLDGRALSLGYYRDGGMSAWVRRQLKHGHVRRAVVFSSPMAQYVDDAAMVRRVYDYCDVDSEKWRAYAAQARWPASAVFRREARTLLEHERNAARAADALLFVSEHEAEVFRNLARDSASKVRVCGLGIDTEYFDPGRAYDNPYAAGELAIVFCGAMDYWPNVDAVRWFARHVFPAVQAEHDRATFWIVGARPTRDVLALTRDRGVDVTGAVRDVRPYLAHAALSVAPLRLARGVQTKVLEAMAMERVVVASPEALAGINAQPGAQAVLAEGVAGFTQAVTGQLRLPARGLGKAARALVAVRYNAATQLGQLRQLLEEPIACPR
jgi:sugar transferase (PEP-CTERM/EpsH1 system associated)